MLIGLWIFPQKFNSLLAFAQNLFPKAIFEFNLIWIWAWFGHFHILSELKEKFYNHDGVFNEYFPILLAPIRIFYCLVEEIKEPIHHICFLKIFTSFLCSNRNNTLKKYFCNFFMDTSIFYSFPFNQFQFWAYS